MDERHTITQLLHDAADGDARAGNELFEALYESLRTIAAARFREERADHTLQPTALVNEVYLKLVGSGTEPPESRLQFFALASRAMRNILIDHARGKNRQKRGGDADRVPMYSVLLQQADGGGTIDALVLEEALNKLASLDERKAKIVELRFFGGLTSEQAADLLGIARSTAADDWRFARAWLSKELRSA